MAGKPQAQTSTLREMAAVEASWVGAMIDGEGAVTFVTSRGKSYWMLQLVNTDVEIISTLLRFTGAGRVCMSKTRKGAKPHWKTEWRWAVAKRNDLISLTRQLSPYSVKMRKMTTRYPDGRE